MGVYLRNEFKFWNVHGLQENQSIHLCFTLTLQETRSIHNCMNIPKFDFIAYIFILL